MLFGYKKRETKSLGQRGEDLAAEYLKKKGYRILERNFTNRSGRRLGEIDIIARKGKEIVFVEVKTRESSEVSEILPEENINRQKLHKLNKIANFYIRQSQLWDAPYHFDAVSIRISPISGQFGVRHLENIFF